jgi:TonB-dependent SusC/RagA subfamily outer membrane receptor
LHLTVYTAPNGQIVIERSAAQDTMGVILGDVVDSAARKGIQQVRIAIQGTKRATLTGEDGAYRLMSVAPGTYVVTAHLLGFRAQQRKVTVRAGDTVRADFVLTSVSTRLSDVVTTGSGERRRVEVGNSIATIDAEKIVQTMPIRNVSDLLATRVPGASVLSSGGSVGSGSQIRIRGISSLTSNNDPIVIVDGIRVEAKYTITGNFGEGAPARNQAFPNASATSRLDDIDPNTIESIDVLRGPSAASLYGSDAANGVIVIKTKRGRPGPTRWRLSYNGTRTTMPATFTESYYGWGTILAQRGSC